MLPRHLRRCDSCSLRACSVPHLCSPGPKQLHPAQTSCIGGAKPVHGIMMGTRRSACKDNFMAPAQHQQVSSWSPVQVCIQCGTTKTPMWRNSPQGPKTMCNACGVKLQRAQNKLRAQALAAGEPEPVFPAAIGAPRHRKAAPVPRAGHGASASRAGLGAAAAGPVTRQRQPGEARGRTRAETAATGDAVPLPAPVVRSVAPDGAAAPTAVAPAPLVSVRAEQAASVKAPAVVFAEDGSAITRTSLGPLAGLKRSSSAVASSASAASVAVALSEGTAPSAAARQRHLSTKRPKTQAQPAPEISEGVHQKQTQHRQQQAAACRLPQQKQQQGSLMLSPFAAATAQRPCSTTLPSLDPSLAPTLSHLELLLPRDGRLAHCGLPRRTSGVSVRAMSLAGGLGPYQGSGYPGSGRVLGIFSSEGRELLSTASPNGRFRWAVLWRGWLVRPHAPAAWLHHFWWLCSVGPAPSPSLACRLALIHLFALLFPVLVGPGITMVLCDPSFRMLCRSSPTSDIVTWTHAEGWTLVFPSQDDWTVFKGEPPLRCLVQIG